MNNDEGFKGLTREAQSIIGLIRDARAEGRQGNYEASQQAYAMAKKEVQTQIDHCKNILEKSKWDSIMNGIVEECTIINSLREVFEETNRILKAEHTVRGKLRLQTAAIRSRPTTKRPSNSSPAKKKPRSQSAAAFIPSKEPVRKHIADMGVIVDDLNVTWTSIMGLDQVKRLLRYNLVILPMHPKLAQGILEPWHSVLLYGPPGTGKTFIAKAVATECRRTFFNVTSATFTSNVDGEAEQLVGELFALAEEMSPSTIFIDEIDAIGSRRNANETDNSRRMKSELLTKMEESFQSDKVFILAATNYPWDLDEALLRRFQKRIYVPLPDQEAREQLIKTSLGDLIDADFNFHEFATKLDGYSCTDIINLCRDAAHGVLEANMDCLDINAQVIVTNQIFRKAIKNRKSSIPSDIVSQYEEWKQQYGAE